LQLTIIGWLPAAIWAVMSRSQGKTEAKLKEMKKRMTAKFGPGSKVVQG
jgi:hypothetical protein